MTWQTLLQSGLLVVDWGIKIVAVGTVPENRRPGSSSAWLLLILFLPFVGLPLYWLIGSPYVRGRRHRIQSQANRVIAAGLAEVPPAPEGSNPSPALAGVLQQNRRLTGLPCVRGRLVGLFGETDDAFGAMAEAVGRARESVDVEFYIVSWDESTDGFFEALAAAVRRGVTVRLLMDQLGSQRYPGWRKLKHRLTEAGIDWHLMMPLAPHRGRWRRPDLRNHRKMLIIDGRTAFVGSHNLIEPSYRSHRNRRIGRRWKDLSVMVTGEVVSSVAAVFATDWFTETGELLRPWQDDPEIGPGHEAMQVIPSGPAFTTEPNLRLFISLIHSAQRRVAITSPYFVPDESLLAAITTAAYRGVEVDLFVGEKADQFVVGRAQRSYYRTLLDAGVNIHLYPAPLILHAKYLTVDDETAVIGSSNMDFRSFSLTYEVMLLAFGGELVERLQANDKEYLAVSRQLTLEDWERESWANRYLDNVCRLAAALM
jgi:cardiolipin synthase